MCEVLNIFLYRVRSAIVIEGRVGGWVIASKRVAPLSKRAIRECYSMCFFVGSNSTASYVLPKPHNLKLCLKFSTMHLPIAGAGTDALPRFI